MNILIDRIFFKENCICITMLQNVMILNMTQQN